MSREELTRQLNKAWDYIRRPPTARMGRLEQLVRWSWRSRVTATGRMLLLLLCATGIIAATIGPRTPLYMLPTFLLSFLFVAWLGGVIFWPRVQVHRQLPERCVCGTTIRIQAQVENTGWFPVFDLGVTEHMTAAEIGLEGHPTYLDYLPRGGSANLEYSLEITRRGAYDFSGPLAISAFPFGLYHSGRAGVAPHRMLVYPRFAPLSFMDLPVGRKHQPGGLQLVSQVGDSEEFLGLREYRPGDRLRDLHHHGWARLGFPVVREFQQEYLCRIALIVDTHAPGAKYGVDVNLEAALSLGAGIAELLSRQEYVIDIFAAGPDLYHFQAGRSLAYLENILDVLACIQGCSESPFQTLAPAIQEEIAQISTAIVVLLDWNEEREKFVRAIRDCGVVVKVVVVRTTPPTNDPTGFTADAGAVQVFTPEQIDTGIERL